LVQVVAATAGQLFAKKGRLVAEIAYPPTQKRNRLLLIRLAGESEEAHDSAQIPQGIVGAIRTGGRQRVAPRRGAEVVEFHLGGTVPLAVYLVAQERVAA
jgi:hypothetical protein